MKFSCEGERIKYSEEIGNTKISIETTELAGFPDSSIVVVDIHAEAPTHKEIKELLTNFLIGMTNPGNDLRSI